MLHNQENPILKRGFRSVINHSYYKTCYDLQQGTGLNLSFSKLSFGEVNKIANFQRYDLIVPINDNAVKINEKDTPYVHITGGDATVFNSGNIINV